MTRGTLIDRTLTRLDAPTDGSGQYTRAEAAAALNAGLALFSFLTLCVERAVTVPIPDGKPFFRARSLLGDWIAPLEIRSNGRRVQPSTLDELDALQRDWPAQTAVQTQHYGNLGFGLVYCYPAGAGTTWSIRYAAFALPLQADEETPEIAAEYHPLISDAYAIAHLAVKEGSSRLASTVDGWRRFLEEAAKYAGHVRQKSLGAQYDSLPIEFKLRDVSRQLPPRRPPTPTP